MRVTISAIFSTCLILAASLSPSSANAAVLHVGPGEAYAKPSLAAAAARDGDIVEIAPGDYTSDTAVWRANGLVLKGVGAERAVLDSRGATAQGKAIWVIAGNDATIENITFQGAKSPDRNGAGIRLEGRGLIVKNCLFRDNQDGILTGASPESDVTIENSEFVHNGAGDGYSHNLYIGHIRHFTLQGCWVHDAHVGHNVKTRAQVSDILFNRIGDDVNSDTSYLIDFPEGGDCRVIGNLLIRRANSLQHALASFAEEGANNAAQSLYLVNNTIVSDRNDTPPLRISGHPILYAVNNLLLVKGAKQSASANLVAPRIAGTFECNKLAAARDFVDATGGDFHLAAGSMAINAGVTPETDSGFSLTPRSEYAAPLGISARPRDKTLDIGAFERR